MFDEPTFFERHLPEWARADDCVMCEGTVTREQDEDYEACWVSDKPRGLALETGEYIQGTGIDLEAAR